MEDVRTDRLLGRQGFGNLGTFRGVCVLMGV